MKIYNEESDEWCFLEVDIQHLEKLKNFSNDIQFLPKRKKNGKVKTLIANLHVKTEYVINVKVLT